MALHTSQAMQALKLVSRLLLGDTKCHHLKAVSESRQVERKLHASTYMHTLLEEGRLLDKHCINTKRLMQGRAKLTCQSKQELVKPDLTCITPQMAHHRGGLAP